jgi:N-carbamoylputrescine amidase
MSAVPARTLRLAAAQFEALPGDVPGNLARHAVFIEEARRREVDLLLFPELSLTDYQLSFDVLSLALPADAPELRELAAAAGNMRVSVGFVEESHGGAFYASQALLGAGEVLSVHRHTSLANYGRLADAKHFGRGGGSRCVDLGGPWRLATMICADTRNPALPWLAALEARRSSPCRSPRRRMRSPRTSRTTSAGT